MIIYSKLHQLLAWHKHWIALGICRKMFRSLVPQAFLCWKFSLGLLCFVHSAAMLCFCRTSLPLTLLPFLPAVSFPPPAVPPFPSGPASSFRQLPNAVCAASAIFGVSWSSLRPLVAKSTPLTTGVWGWPITEGPGVGTAVVADSPSGVEAAAGLSWPMASDNTWREKESISWGKLYFS